jgi:hypothetical protein
VSIDVVLDAGPRDLGEGFTVRRALPDRRRRSVGPFVFFDQMGPVDFAPGKGMDVRPHPHIGLSTVTYLFDGNVTHRDSLGFEQVIHPGDVNWMTAGRGIVHSERTEHRHCENGMRLFGIQTWVALPEADQEVEPSFHHHPQDTLPTWTVDGASVRLVAGTYGGQTSPVCVYAPLFDLAIEAPAGARVALPREHDEAAIYSAQGALRVGGQRYDAGQLLVLAPGADPTFEAVEDAKVMVFGGAPLDGPRHMFWNFVSSSKARIEQAKADWKAMRLGTVPGDDEFIPLPE